MKVKYLIHAKTQEDYEELISLYYLYPQECERWTDRHRFSCNPDLIHLWPRADGRYLDEIARWQEPAPPSGQKEDE